jgi:prepilin-type N-terminal cleavage/methylation domain-containing protein
MRSRPGFTLWEMAIVLAIMSVGAAIVIPRLTEFGQTPPPVPGDLVTSVLRDARRAAIARSMTVTIRIDPKSGQYRADTTGIAGTGTLAEGTLDVSMWESLDTDRSRLTFVFRPSGAAFGDTVRVRGSTGTVMVSVDPWSGMPVIHAR